MLEKPQPTTTNNNIHNHNTVNFVYVNIQCPDDILSALQNLTIEHQMQNGYGIGMFLMDYVLKGKILVHDMSRKIISCMLNDKVIKDNGDEIILNILKPIDKETSKRSF